MRKAWVYFLASRSGVLYTGVTSDVPSRVWEHKIKKYESCFTAQYNVDRLVYYEAFPKPYQALKAEKKIKGWLREKKIALIESNNPQCKDLSEGWYGQMTGDAGASDLPSPYEGLPTAKADLQPEVLRCAQDDVLHRLRE